MKEQIVSSEVAILAKELGFNWKTSAYYIDGEKEYSYKEVDDEEGDIELQDLFDNYNHNISKQQKKYSNYASKSFYTTSAPTQSLLQKWLREEKGYHLEIRYIYEFTDRPFSYRIYEEGESEAINEWIKDYNTYEETLEKALHYVLDYIINYE